MLSTSSMLLLDQRTLQIKYRVPATEIYRLSLSPYLDNIAVFHVKAVSFYVNLFIGVVEVDFVMNRKDMIFFTVVRDSLRNVAISDFVFQLVFETISSE